MHDTKRAVHPSGLGLTFTESSHSYIDDDGMHYTSGTSVVKLVKPIFDENNCVSGPYAIKNGLTIPQVKAQWKKSGEDACTFGTMVHAHGEGLLIGNSSLLMPVTDEKSNLAKQCMENAVKIIQQDYTFLCAEMILFSPAMAIAGMADVLAVDHKSKTLWILDFKTNKEILRISPYDNYMSHPLSHLHDVNFNHYSLQLSLYRYIIEREGYLTANGMDGYRVRGMLIHIPPMSEKPVFMESSELAVETRDMIIKHLTNVSF